LASGGFGATTYYGVDGYNYLQSLLNQTYDFSQFDFTQYGLVQEDPRNPDNKKNITFEEARLNFLRGKEEKLYQDILSMGVKLHESDFTSKGIAVINYDQKGFNGVSNALIHGNVTFERVPGNPGYAQVKYVDEYGCRCGKYNFEMHGNPLSTRNNYGLMLRNAATAIGGIVNSSYRLDGLVFSGKPFLIQYTNLVKILK
jgi:hypothetical protein